MPPGLLPYYLALAPSPSDARLAFAVARPMTADEDPGVSVCVEDPGPGTCVEVFRFSRFAGVLLGWSADAERLAFAQGTVLMTRDRDGGLQMSSLQDPVEAIGFDEGQRLWVLAGGRLEAIGDDRAVMAFDAVVAFAAHGWVAYARREVDGVGIHAVEGGQVRRLASIARPFESITLSIAGRYLVVAMLSAPCLDAIDACVLRIELSSARIDEILDCRLPTGFNAGPGLQVAIGPDGAVHAACELAACTQLWSLGPGRSPVPVTPDGFEVFEFALHPLGERLAVIASDTRTPEGGADRQLLLGQRIGDDWRFLPPMAGIHEMPRWRGDGRLEVLRGDDGAWVKARLDPDAPQPDPSDLAAQAASRLPCRLVAPASTTDTFDLLQFAGPRHRGTGILLLPRLHQQFVAGAQAFFFHHLLFSIARALAADGHAVAIVSGPGAIGRGQARRRLSQPYLTALPEVLVAAADLLRQRGCRSVGLLAGSLAAVPGLRVLGAGSAFSAAAFVAPLFEASIPITAPVRQHLLDPVAVRSFDAAAADLSVPVLVVHGALDEVAPLSQVVRLCQATGASGLVDVCLLEGEGHIFRKPGSWRCTASRIGTFFASALRAGRGWRSTAPG